MTATAFEYHAPTTLQEALSLLTRYSGEAKILAGGHSLIPIMNLRLAQPKALIDIGKIPGLSGIREDNGAVVIGAMTTHHQVETSAVLQAKVPILPETAAVIGDVQVRNRGTIGGSIAHADPAGDFPAAAVALDLQLKVVGPKGERTIKGRDFFVDILTTALQPDEILTEIRVPAFAARTGSAYEKFPNPASRYAIVGAAAVVTVDASVGFASALAGTCSPDDLVDAADRALFEAKRAGKGTWRAGTVVPPGSEPPEPPPDSTIRHRR